MTMDFFVPAGVGKTLHILASIRDELVRIEEIWTMFGDEVAPENLREDIDEFMCSQYASVKCYLIDRWVDKTHTASLSFH